MTKDEINRAKAELLDEFVLKLKSRIDMQFNLMYYERNIWNKYHELPTAKTFTEDPYVDEMTGKRLYNLIKDCYFALNGNWKRDIRVSELPSLQDMKDHCRNFGKKSIHEFNELKKRYENS